MNFKRSWAVLLFAVPAFSFVGCTSDTVISVTVRPAASVTGPTADVLVVSSVDFEVTKTDGETFTRTLACANDGSTDDFEVGYNLHPGETIYVYGELQGAGVPGSAEAALTYDDVNADYDPTSTGPYVWTPILAIDTNE